MRMIMKLLITGSKGFIGKNLSLRLREYHNIELLTFERGQDISYLTQALDSADAVIHLAGENRPDGHRAESVSTDSSAPHREIKPAMTVQAVHQQQHHKGEGQHQQR